MHSLSVILITRNEESNLDECLASLNNLASQIVVVDSQSNDKTLEIAKKYSATIDSPADWPGFGPQKNRALKLATEEWVLSIDADERLTPALRDEINHILAHPKSDHSCFAIPRRSWYLGKFMNHSGWYPDYVVRLFRRGAAEFSDDLVHEQLLCKGDIGRLRNPLLHFSFMNKDQVQVKVERYSTASALQAFAKGKKSSPLKAVLHGAWSFMKTYFIRIGFLDGIQGYQLARSNAQGTYLRYIKLWKLNRGMPIDE
jgi:glycosyltransferase involved in cell wall biosynthesis